MGNDNKNITAEEFLKNHGEDDYSFSSIFENDMFVSLESMIEEEEEKESKQYNKNYHDRVY